MPTEIVINPVFSIATNITSGSEEGGSDSDEEMDVTTGVEIAGMEMFEEEGQSLTENMNRALIFNLVHPSRHQKRAAREKTPTTVKTQATTQRVTPMILQPSTTSIQKTMTRLSRCPRASLMRFTPTSFRHQTTSSSNYGTMRVPQLIAC